MASDLLQIVLALAALLLSAVLFLLLYVRLRQIRERTTALREAIQHLKEIDRVKSEFISLASHQLRTPLTGIRWAHHALLEGQAGVVNEEQRRILERSLDRTQAMMGLVGELLDVARIEDQKYRLLKESTDTGELVRGVVDQFSEAAERRKISLDVSVDSNLPKITIDKTKLNIALGNLVDNAIKYTPPGGKVTVSAMQSDEMVCIKVLDTGIGIPQGDQYRAFSKFFRSSNAIAMHTRGSGLGLYISRTIIEKHGGTIAVDSAEGKGSTFTICLPIR
ncbi:MAG: HAMP domain-containing histidine kinase [Candidatus Andersenbacteria bacterium]|nr:HAMP domain-containing histidine kinase [Candidatus Andersenbacteria bacterium]MBI3250646.1 HAMP domain-containing histidine kinase [Candidatus Andersenbacteria bacterium]